MKYLLFASLLSLNISTLALDVKCSRDRRPTDGNLNEFNLVNNSKNNFTLYVKFATAGFGSKLINREFSFENLTCKQDAHITFCKGTKHDLPVSMKISEQQTKSLSSLKENAAHWKFIVFDLYYKELPNEKFNWRFDTSAKKPDCIY